ncbi:PadR family transcriptional regulator [Candidatus Bathyarchaeota archaeon]|nr:PadR family transcriptional regulator [Candidatus Bathyarchaeota archaeon]MBT4319638.1 PadR family transcriptional regulator [Candidatus Bathyarchaeota archaeon]MBT4424679.1 PadR family transcriptional regulator [Candidatus Bathyarchaeota archaeon]MBT7187340.1 PadR family transcriptional regulator [Candidatus Bathyarchaeota archaeon]MBT7346829.1 PadR family transcriptional regulator [Candidatus Bathyarchaeota archaeon]
MTHSSGKVPRGFTRYYVLYLLSEKELTGKGIIEESINRSDGDWAPSPGLIYPLLGRLVRDGLISELDGGKFTTTDNGLEELSTHGAFQDQIENQFNLVNKLGLSMFAAGKFLTEEALDRISTVTTTVRSKVGKRSNEAQQQFDEKYEAFLLQELDKLKLRKTTNLTNSDP